MTGWAVVPRVVVMALGGQGAGPGPGTPGAPARPPGWLRRGCRRPPRTARTARSRRPATRRPPPAGPVRSRPGGRPRPAPRTGTWSFVLACDRDSLTFACGGREGQVVVDEADGG